MIIALQLILVAALVGVGFRLLPRLRAWRRSKTAGRMMARTLRTSIRNQNARQAIAALREKRDVEVLPLERAMASRADLSQRIERIRLRVLARSAAVSREAGSRKQQDPRGGRSGSGVTRDNEAPILVLRVAGPWRLAE